MPASGAVGDGVNKPGSSSSDTRVGAGTGAAASVPRRDSRTGAAVWASCADHDCGIERREAGTRSRLAGIGHKPVLGGDDIARPQCRIAVRLVRRKTERVAAIAGAIGHKLLAIDECIVDVGVALAVAGPAGADFAAEKHLGLARRAHRPASLDRRGIARAFEREMLAVAQPDAECDAMTGIAALVHALGAARRYRRNTSDRGRRFGVGVDVGRTLLKTAEEQIE